MSVKQTKKDINTIARTADSVQFNESELFIVADPEESENDKIKTLNYAAFRDRVSGLAAAAILSYGEKTVTESELTGDATTFEICIIKELVFDADSPLFVDINLFMSTALLGVSEEIEFVIGETTFAIDLEAYTSPIVNIKGAFFYDGADLKFVGVVKKVNLDGTSPVELGKNIVVTTDIDVEDFEDVSVTYSTTFVGDVVKVSSIDMTKLPTA